MSAEKSKRELIIEAAIQEFQEKGFESASMDRITCRAGVSKRTVYNHFESKAILFKVIISVMADQLKEGKRVEFNPELPLREQLLELGMQKGKVLRSKPFMNLVRIAVSETLRDPGSAKSVQQKSEVEEEYSQFFKDAIKAGALKSVDPKLVEEQFIGMIKAQAFWPAIFSGSVLGKSEMEKVVEESTDTILAAHAAD